MNRFPTDKMNTCYCYKKQTVLISSLHANSKMHPNDWLNADNNLHRLALSTFCSLFDVTVCLNKAVNMPTSKHDSTITQRRFLKQPRLPDSAFAIRRRGSPDKGTFSAEQMSRQNAVNLFARRNSLISN